MSDDKEMARSEMSTAESAFRGAAEAPRGARDQATGDGEGATHTAFADKLAHLAAVSGPDAQEEARFRGLARRICGPP